MGVTKNMTSVCAPSISMYVSYTGLKKVRANHFWKVRIEKHSLLWTKLYSAKKITNNSSIQGKTM